MGLISYPRYDYVGETHPAPTTVLETRRIEYCARCHRRNLNSERGVGNGQWRRVMPRPLSVLYEARQ